MKENYYLARSKLTMAGFYIAIGLFITIIAGVATAIYFMVYKSGKGLKIGEAVKIFPGIIPVIFIFPSFFAKKEMLKTVKVNMMEGTVYFVNPIITSIVKKQFMVYDVQDITLKKIPAPGDKELYRVILRVKMKEYPLFQSTDMNNAMKYGQELSSVTNIKFH